MKCERSIHGTISKNNLALFKRPKPKAKSKQAKAVAMLKYDVALFSRLFIVAKNRECDMPSFFKHENQSFPPSISEYGKLRSSKKSDLLPLLAQNDFGNPPDTLRLMVAPADITTFDQYADDVVIPYILKQLERSTRVDVVWDTYITDSIKASTREKRGKGIRQKVAGKTREME